MRRLALMMCLAAGPCVVTTFLPTGVAMAKGKAAADVLKGRIILAQRPFPTRFKSEAEMATFMKRTDMKGFKFGEGDKIPIEFMAFFAQPIAVTQLTGTVYDVTEGLEMKDTFPIYPGDRGTRVLASFMELRRETFEVERRYKFVITTGFRGTVLAETDFAIKE
ncbi:MAG: hypothetical protein EXR76_06565 [Myxococcales bacterium]|nr:hypothetical protein [Myxococcales bacterium]